MHELLEINACITRSFSTCSAVLVGMMLCDLVFLWTREKFGAEEQRLDFFDSNHFIKDTIKNVAICSNFEFYGSFPVPIIYFSSIQG
jgi:hypothetical protein